MIYSGRLNFFTFLTVILFATASDIILSWLPSNKLLLFLSISGSINRIEELANVLQVVHDAGATKVLLPNNAKKQLVDVPDDLLNAITLLFYNSPEDAIFKALGVD